MLLRALGFPADTPDNLNASIQRLNREGWSRPLPPVAVVREGISDFTVPLVLPANFDRSVLSVSLHAENGDARRMEFRVTDLALDDTRQIDGRRLERRRLRLAALPPAGYHRLIVAGPGDGEAEMSLIVAPDRCHLPEGWQDGGTDDAAWGWSVDLFARRSPGNGGLGTFSDLGTMAEASGRLGVAVLALNPLHALFVDQPDRCSPYSPNSRLFLNPLYIDPTTVPEFAVSDEAKRIAASAPHQAMVTAAQEASLIDYRMVAAHRMPLLEALFRCFQERHAGHGTERDLAFQRFRREGGQRLEDFARFEALGERLRTPGCSTWSAWPAPYRDPRSPAVSTFADEHRDRVNFHLFLQWEAARQRHQAAERAKVLPLGFGGDVAVGFDRDGFDAWSFQDLVPDGISVGCPPDLRNPLGQDWGVCPFDPRKLREAAYGPFVELLRACMRDAGMLRIDHAFQLARLFWVPLGRTARAGGYVRYPIDDLLGILALESRRNRCAILAEDLGTFPEGFPERMAAVEALSFRVLHREREAERTYRPPSAYPRLAVVTAGTHDQATLSGFWTGRDIAVRAELDLYPSPDLAEQAKAQRVIDRQRLLEALRQYGGLEGEAEDGQGRPSLAFVLAVHRFLAKTPARLVLVQLGDILGHEDQINLPGTTTEYPNWRRRSLINVGDLAADARITALAEVFRTAGRPADRPTGSPSRHAGKQGEN